MKFKIIGISIILFILLGCSLINGPNKTTTAEPFDNFKYPLKVGNSWTYEYSRTYLNIRPDTNRFLFNDTILDTIKIEVTKIDTLNDTLEVYKLSRVAFNNNVYLGFDYYYVQNETGLYTTAQKELSDGSPAMEFFFDDMSDMNNKNFINGLAISSYEYLFIKYPIKLNTEWENADHYGDYYTKKITLFDTLTTNVGTFDCFITETETNRDDNTLSDYISSAGLIKRSYNQINWHYGNGTHTATYDKVEELNLIEINLSQ